MPQHLHIEVDDGSLARMSTYNVSGACYDVRWDVAGGSTSLFYPSVDTGVPRQPSDPVERDLDFQNDFIHARRSIGAALATAR